MGDDRLAMKWWHRLRERLPAPLRRWLTPPSPPDDPLWRLWRDVWRQTPNLALVLSGLRDGRRGATLDTLTVLVTDRRRARMRTTIVAADPALRRRLLGLARLNLERASGFTRLMLLAYFTVPLTVGAILAQLAPQWLTQTLTDYRQVVAGVVSGAAVALVVRVVSESRARLIVAMVEVAMIERDEPL